jgi:hypothetical protein
MERLQSGCGNAEAIAGAAPAASEKVGHARTGGAAERREECTEILHSLNNVLASVLLNAQVMEWKLPSYSRTKRYLHEIERNAQRGGELVRRLLGRLLKEDEADVGDPRIRPHRPDLVAEGTEVTSAGAGSAQRAPDHSTAGAVAELVSHRTEVSHTIV